MFRLIFLCVEIIININNGYAANTLIQDKAKSQVSENINKTIPIVAPGSKCALPPECIQGCGENTGIAIPTPPEAEGAIICYKAKHEGFICCFP